jgi:hypothetical protein
MAAYPTTGKGRVAIGQTADTCLYRLWLHLPHVAWQGLPPPNGGPFWQIIWEMILFNKLFERWSVLSKRWRKWSVCQKFHGIIPLTIESSSSPSTARASVKFIKYKDAFAMKKDRSCRNLAHHRSRSSLTKMCQPSEGTRLPRWTQANGFSVHHLV